MRRWLILLCCLTACTINISVTLSADAKVDKYDLYARDDATSQIVLHTGFTSTGNRDLRKSPLKIALKVPNGHYTLLIVGVIGDVVGGKPGPNSTQLFWAGRVHIDGAADIDIPAKLLTVPPGDDADGDLWPDATNFIAHVPAAAALYKNHPDLLDCDDVPMALSVGGGVVITIHGSDVNPFAVETCADGFDKDCDGKILTSCVDKDKDGDPSVTDCDDNDPKRHHATAMDPFPDPPNCCGYSLGKKGTADENKDFTGDPVLCPFKRCGDGIDESCQGKDTACVVDADCDGYPAPPIGDDCDDHDPNVHPGAIEACGSTKDLNCDGVVNGGCVPCDLDGDGFERSDPANGCPDLQDKHPGMTDCNDYDSSVHPGATIDTGGTEAGGTLAQRVISSLRGYCRRIYEPTGTTGTAKVSSFGWLVGDMDCNGVAYEGCPPPECDADGDGWPVNEGNCQADADHTDCNDNDPTFFPGAPVSCGNNGTMAENCTTKQLPCDNDADHDGWNASEDCNDHDPSVHPWAAEACDDKDNDCDGLVDEGNPDATGKPMIANGAVMSCTDSDVGECGQTKGACVCSPSTPGVPVHAESRLACPTEVSGAAKPPHCFGAGQPHPQSCDAADPKDDDCDGRSDAPDGKDLLDRGQVCGGDSGTPGGHITACDFSQTPALVCSTD